MKYPIQSEASDGFISLLRQVLIPIHSGRHLPPKFAIAKDRPGPFMRRQEPLPDGFIGSVGS